MTALNVLDCTLRDGGYYNDWNFARDTVENYLHAIEGACIEAIEIGFRGFSGDRFLGPYAYCTDSYLRSLPLPKGVELAVMVDAKQLLAYGRGPAAAVDALFRPRVESPLSLVRVAAHFAEVPRCCPAVTRLKELGYRVGLNVMQAGGKPPDKLAATATTIGSWNSVDVLYFADSLGNMDSNEVRATIAALRRGWDGLIGVHAHDNMGHALANSIAAIEAGASWIDGTILGMGRGAGNVCMEYLLLELARRRLGPWRPEALFPLVVEDFERLKKRYGWGTSLPYYMSALYGIHPTYVQTMLADGRYRTEDVLAGLANLKDGGAAYSVERLQAALQPTPESFPGTWSAAGWAAERTVLLVASGPGVAEHRDTLVDYIDNARPVVIALNAKTALPADRVTAFVTCHPVRFAVEAPMYRHMDRPVVAPLAALTAAVRRELEKVTVLDYGLEVRPGTFEAGERGCVLPRQLVAAYALALANAAGAKKILLAGFDGYPPADARHKVMLEVLALYEKMPSSAPLMAITPTNYPVRQSSVYALSAASGDKPAA